MPKTDADHPISVTQHPKALRVVCNGLTVARTTKAMSLREAGYEPVLYIPREDANWDLLRPNSKRTTCPHKGEANYFDIVSGGVTVPAAIWSYEHPLPAVARIEGHLAFYRDKVVFEDA